jgi:hypothetical protein
MNHERALLLAEALESGRYIQGPRVLERHVRNEDGTVTVKNCCLGVAVRLAQANGVDVAEVLDGDAVEFNGNSCSLNAPVLDWFGFKNAAGAFGETEDYAEEIEGWSSLIGLNDSGCFNFADIARIIRENWELL